MKTRNGETVAEAVIREEGCGFIRLHPFPLHTPDHPACRRLAPGREDRKSGRVIQSRGPEVRRDSAGRLAARSDETVAGGGTEWLPYGFTILKGWR